MHSTELCQPLAPVCSWMESLPQSQNAAVWGINTQEFPGTGLRRHSPLARGHRGAAWQHRRNPEGKKPPPAAAGRVQPWLQGLGRNGSGFSPDVGARPHRPQLELEPAQPGVPGSSPGEQPDRSWLWAPRSRAQTRCDCASDSAEWSRQQGTGSLQSVSGQAGKGSPAHRRLPRSRSRHQLQRGISTQTLKDLPNAETNGQHSERSRLRSSPKAPYTCRVGRAPEQPSCLSQPDR